VGIGVLTRPAVGKRLGAVLVVIAVVVTLAVLFADAPARWLVVRDPREPADAALVLTGDLDFERTDHAAKLARSGEARLLVLTGGMPFVGDSAESLRDRALADGVPAERIRLENTSTDTWESLVAVRPILSEEHVKTLLLVSSPYHMRRASLAARRALPGIRILCEPAPCSHWRPEGWWRSSFGRRIVVGEYVKLVYYVLRGWI
jgi:uncharacterized SAM-binding protein YcdF (DUF218 family)